MACGHLCALIRKNWIIKQRNGLCTCLEILVPVFFILGFCGLKSLQGPKTIPVGWSDNSDNSSSSSYGTSRNLFEGVPSSPEFYQTESTLPGFLSYMSLRAYKERDDTIDLSSEQLFNCTKRFLYQGHCNPDPTAQYSIPEECKESIIPYKLAITPDNLFTRNYFYAKLAQWYPRIPLDSSQTVVIPSLSDSIAWFDSESDLEDYISGKSYGSSTKNFKIFGAIVFKEYPKTSDEISLFGQIEYSIRLNGTAPEGDREGDVPQTKGLTPAVRNAQKSISTDYSIYVTKGFLTLQTLVNRFIICQPTWDGNQPGTCQVDQTSPTSMDEYIVDQIYGDSLLLEYLDSFNKAQQQVSISLKTLTNSTMEKLLMPLRYAPQPYFGAKVYPFPIEEYVENIFYTMVTSVFGLAFILAFAFAVTRVTTVFVSEKEMKARELMKIMGVSQKAIIASWYITYIKIFLVQAILIALASQLGIFEESNGGLIFFFFFVFALDVLAYAYFVSTFFNTAKIASISAICVFFGLYFISYGISSTTAESAKTFLCIFPPVALNLGINVIASLEEISVGLQSGNTNLLIDNNRFSNVIGMMIFDFFLYTLLGAYFEEVLPKEFGTRRPWYFPFCLATWKCNNKTEDDLENVDNITNPGKVVSDTIEPIHPELLAQEANGKAAIIRNLRKVFSVPGGEKIAVKGLSLNMYEGQILCLLGHNGAGKTTTISMLTGMMEPSSGDAILNGYSIVKNLDQVRKSIGMCPQHDVLYNDLTVKEHLELFGRIKGYSGKELEDIIQHKISEVGLREKVNAFPQDLSGGMKRKLCLSIALLGDSKIVFLDEPTSGMDPYSRRSTWEMLQNNRKNRIMVLTTHFMDEADLLGDRIAIMADGELRCCGSSFFLKKRFGAGYNLSIVKEAKCKTDELISIVSMHVATAHVLSNVGTEITFQLPIDASSNFPSLFTQLDNSMKTIGISQYGISVTTMEEVFLKVAEVRDESSSHASTASTTPTETPIEGLHGASVTTLKTKQDKNEHSQVPLYRLDRNKLPNLFFVHLKALLTKRYHYSRRDKRGSFCGIILPIILILIGLIILKVSSLTSNQPNYRLNFNAYDTEDETPTPYYCTEDDQNWCSTVLNSNYYQEGSPYKISNTLFGNPPYPNNSTSSVIVYNLNYSNELQMDVHSTMMNSLRMGEMVLNQAYGINGVTEAKLGQYGGYLIYASNQTSTFGYNILVNTTSLHAAPIYKSAVDDALYRYFSERVNPSLASKSSIVTNHHPLPLTAQTKALFSSYLAFTAVLFITIAFAFIPATIVMFVVKEKDPHRNSKHQQLVSGVNIIAYWLANFIWDYLVYCVPFLAAIIMIVAFDITSFTGSSCALQCTENSMGAVVLLFFFFGLAIIPFTYVLSYMFKDYAVAQYIVLMFNLLIGLALVIVSFILDLISSTSDINKSLKFLWRLSPLFDLGNGLFNLALAGGSVKKNANAFDMDICGWELLYLGLEVIIFLFFALGIDYALTFPALKAIFSRGPTNVLTNVKETDEDVLLEQERVQSGGASKDLLILEGIKKSYYGGKVAVRNLTFGLPQGQCFGFLGINGAGKSTTMKMLTGDVVPTQGRATVGGFDIMTQQLDVRRLIGYCPQFDALFDLLSVREHLELFARIKGIPSQHLEHVVAEKIKQMDLIHFEHKLAGTLSGGNKRKLSVAIALIGSPPVVFLDEPSTGMDPVARRFMWNVICGISTESKESTIVLTTHSMEECEALCNQVGIMVGGRLRCLGSIQHLKSRFGDGMMMEIKLLEPQEEVIMSIMGKLNDIQNITKQNLEHVCKMLGNEERASFIRSDHQSGWLLDSMLNDSGSIQSEFFCSWWTGEDRNVQLVKFMEKTFANSKLVERNSDFYRFKVPNKGSSLAKMFQCIEDHKNQLCIREYSICQTSLEQIFNQFAREQEEEKGVARGLNLTNG